MTQRADRTGARHACWRLVFQTHHLRVRNQPAAASREVKVGVQVIELFRKRHELLQVVLLGLARLELAQNRLGRVDQADQVGMCRVRFRRRLAQLLRSVSVR